MAEASSMITRRSPRWQFSISCDTNNKTEATPIGIRMSDFDLFDRFADICGSVSSDWERDGRRHKSLKVDEPGESQKLASLMDAIAEGLGYRPSPHRIVPEEDRGRFFGVKRKSVFTDQDIDASRFLQLTASRFQIGSWMAPTEDELASETYVVENDACQKTKVEFGFVSPFPALGISEPLKRKLESKNLEAIRFEPIVVRRKSGKPRKPLWKIWSSIVLPRSSTRLVTSQGHVKDPWNDFSDRWSDAFYDDQGCYPPLLEYSEADLAKLPAFDVALTAEHTGNCRDRVFRTTIVTQRFRQNLSDLKVKGVEYVPVSVK